MNCIILVIYLFCCSTVVKSAKILAIFPSPGYSQYFVGEPLLIQLARRGHEITLVSFHKPKQPINNIIPIEVRGLKAFNEGKHPMRFVVLKKTFSLQKEMSLKSSIKIFLLQLGMLLMNIVD